LLHDIGKLRVGNSILDKLNFEQWSAMKMHAVHTEAILSRMAANGDLARVAAAHHERFDGTGYQRGFAGADVALETRIVTTADIFDARTADRPLSAVNGGQ
jgi:HD-GYP domain-containing protein (c-di-GMP phosphodiesterase class II)